MYIAADEVQVIEEQEPTHELAHDYDRYENDVIDETDPLHNTQAYFNKLNNKGSI